MTAHWLVPRTVSANVHEPPPVKLTVPSGVRAGDALLVSLTDAVHEIGWPMNAGVPVQATAVPVARAVITISACALAAPACDASAATVAMTVFALALDVPAGVLGR